MNGVTFPMERLAEIRASAGWSQLGLAMELGVSPRTVQRWENLECKPRQRDVQSLLAMFPAAGTNGSKKRGR